MVVLLIFESRAVIYFFDGLARISWGYNHGEFTTDEIGKQLLVGGPVEFTLKPNANKVMPAVLQREFAEHDMSIGKLWRLNPNASDYAIMQVMHGDDIGVRISFE